MRTRINVFGGLILVVSGACARRDTTETDRRIEDRKIEDHTDNAARKAGSAAYKLAEETKEAARKAGHELRVAGSEARQGWNDAKHEEKAKGKEPVR